MNHHRVLSFTLIAIITLYFCSLTVQLAVAQEEEFFFTITLIAAPHAPVGVLPADLIVNELPKIGIKGNLHLLGWDQLFPRMLYSTTHADYDGGGFDIGFLGWTDSVVPSQLFKFFHSSNIDPVSGGFNYYPVNNKTLDGILEFVMNTTDFTQRKEYIRSALQMIVWDIHPVTGIWQPEELYYMQNNIHGFDSQRFPKIEELYFANGHSAGHGQVNELIVASTSRPLNYNSLLSNYWHDKFAFSPVFTRLVERDRNLTFVPGFAELLPYPVAVKNNYTGELSSTDPNTATVWELKLRKDVFWHEGYGYRMNNATHRDILKVDADDVVWFYIINTLEQPNGPPSLFRSSFQYVFGSDPDKAIVKVDRYTVQFHLKNLYADLFILFGIILPQHILDPTYNAFGFGSGVRADGTSAPSYDDWEIDDFNLGRRTNGDLERPATIGNGGYLLYPGENIIQQTINLTKWNHYFKDNDTSYWQSLVANRPDQYIYTWITSKEAAKTALENGSIDIMDTRFDTQRDFFMNNKPGIAVARQLSWGYQTMGYNILNGAGSKLANKWVRLAISHIVPREDIVKYISDGFGNISFAPFPQQSPFWPADLRPIEYNLTKALDYMEKADYDVTLFRDSEPQETSTSPSFPYNPHLFDPLIWILFTISGIEVVIIVFLLVLVIKKRVSN